MKSNHLNPLVHDFLMTYSQKLFNAAQGGDSDFAQATLTTLHNEIPSYIRAIVEERNDSDRRNI